VRGLESHLLTLMVKVVTRNREGVIEILRLACYSDCIGRCLEKKHIHLVLYNSVGEVGTVH